MEGKAVHSQLPFLRRPFDRHIQAEAWASALVGLESMREGRGFGGVACGTEMAGSEGRGVVKGERGGGGGDEDVRGEEDGNDENGLHDTDERGRGALLVVLYL